MRARRTVPTPCSPRRLADERGARARGRHPRFRARAAAAARLRWTATCRWRRGSSWSTRARRDDGAELARARGAELVSLPDNPGFGAANNAGLARVREPLAALVNPDVELLDDGLARLAARAQATPRLLAPGLRNADGTRQRSAHPLPGTPGSARPGAAPARGAAARDPRARRALALRARAHGRLGDRRVRRRAHRAAALTRAVRSADLPVLRGSRSVPARAGRRCADRAAPRDRAPPRRGALDLRRVRRGAPRHDGSAPARGGGAGARLAGARARRRGAGGHVRHAYLGTTPARARRRTRARPAAGARRRAAASARRRGRYCRP